MVVSVNLWDTVNFSFSQLSLRPLKFLHMQFKNIIKEVRYSTITRPRN